MSEETRQTVINEESVEVMTPSAVSAIESAQINQQIATAKRYPRNIDKVLKSMTAMVSLDEDTAASCFYSIPRGKDDGGRQKYIEGPSIRMAEIAVSCYGNLRVATRIIDEVLDGPTPHVKVQAVTHDLESNVAVCLEKRRRITKKRNATRPDEDDLNLAVNSCAALAFRDSVFKVIPGVLTKKAYQTAREVAIGDAKTLSSRIDRAFAWFLKIGISNPRVLKAIEKDAIGNVTAEDLATLTGFMTAIKDGAATIESVFPKEAPAEGAPNTGADSLAKRLKKDAPKAEPAPLTDAEKADIEAREAKAAAGELL
jgi:hypothetical protein